MCYIDGGPWLVGRTEDQWQRSVAATKGWTTRRAAIRLAAAQQQKRKRRRAALKGWDTRRRKAAAPLLNPVRTGRGHTMVPA